MKKIWNDRLWVGACAAGAAVALAPVAAGSIDVTFSPVNSTVSVGDTVDVQVFVTSDTSDDQLMAAMQAIFTWETTYLQLTGHSQAGAVNLLFSGFPADPYGINESSPPQDGTGLYQALAPLGNPVAATASGTLLTTLQFLALAPTEATLIDMLESAGDPQGNTIVFDGTTPNTDVTGILTGTQVMIIPAPAAFVLLCGVFAGPRRRRIEVSN